MPDYIWQLLYQIGIVSIVPLAGALAAVLIQKIKLQSLSITESTWEKIKIVVKIAVESSEQQYKADTSKAFDRKTHAVEIAKKMLSDKKIKFDDDLLSEMIEAQVWDSKNSPDAKGVISIAPIEEAQKIPNIT
jgi:hypothetical protein